MDLAGFIDTYRDAIARRVVESYPPRYRPSEPGRELPPLLRAPLGAQADAIRGAALSLEAQRGTTVVGEMGTGKTFIAASAAHMACFERVLVLCPPHLTRKWKREVEETVPGARAVIVASITDLERLRAATGTGPLFAIMSRERAKLSYRWQPPVVERWATTARGLVRHEETGEPFRVPCCPDCHAQIVDKDGVPLLGRDLARRKRWCPECRSALWQADRSGPKRYPLADYVKHRLKGFFDLLIGDEIHEFKSRGSAQGIAAGILADACGKSLSLSGALMGGYSSTLLHLLYRFSPEIRTEFERSEEGRWIERYGFVEHTVGRDDGDSLEDGRTSRRRKYRKVIRERPGLAPAALFHLIGNSVFLRLSDVAGLPSIEERVLLSSMADATGLSQRSGYDRLFGTPRRCWSTRSGPRPSRWRRKSSRSRRGLTPVATTPRRRGGRCSRGRSSWPGNRRSRSAAAGTKLRRSRSSSGRSTGSARGNWSARSARPVNTGGPPQGVRWPPLARRCVWRFLRSDPGRTTARRPSSVPGAPTRPWPAGSIAAAEGSRLNSGSGSFFVRQMAARPMERA